MILEQLAHQFEGGGLVPLALNEHLQDLAFVIDDPPQRHQSAADAHDHFVQVPVPAERRPEALQVAGDRWPERHHPAAHRLVRHVEAALRQELFDIAVAQREPQMQRDRGWTMTRDFGRAAA